MTFQPRHPERTTPFVLRCIRLIRLAGHLVGGLMDAWLRYPRLNAQRRRTVMRGWSRRLLSILGVTVRVLNAPHSLPASCMIVSNHISWIDIFVLTSIYPAIFVAKSEIRRWPLIGSLCARAGTLFIKRNSRSSAKRTATTVTAAIRSGALVSIYPEGTTTDGKCIRRFHAALFQPAIDAEAVIQPAALRYLDREDHYCSAPNFVGDTSFVASLWNITAAPRIVAELSFLKPIETDSQDRRVLARASQTAIAGALGVQVSGIPPETIDDLPGESQ